MSAPARPDDAAVRRAGARPADALLGVRGFRVGPSGALRSLTNSADPELRDWNPAGPTVAYCSHEQGRGPCENPECHCGLNAFRDLVTARRRISRNRRYRRRDPVLALVCGWGDIAVHRAGWRARYGQVVALLDEPDAASDRRRLIRQAARCYGVPVVAEGWLDAVSGEHGRWLTDADLPAPRSLLGSLRRPVVWQFVMPQAAVALLLAASIVAVAKTSALSLWLLVLCVAPLAITLACVAAVMVWELVVVLQLVWAVPNRDDAVIVSVLLAALGGSAALIVTGAGV